MQSGLEWHVSGAGSHLCHVLPPAGSELDQMICTVSDVPAYTSV